MKVKELREIIDSLSYECMNYDIAFEWDNYLTYVNNIGIFKRKDKKDIVFSLRRKAESCEDFFEWESITTTIKEETTNEETN